MPARSRLSTIFPPLAAWSALILACDPPRPPDPLPPAASLAQPIEPDGAELLAEAVDLYERQVAEQYIRATDFGEHGELLVSEGFVRVLAEQGQYEDLFNTGDESFEGEVLRRYGYGQGPLPPLPLPGPTRRLQTGELGGADSSSCRSCHFVGGADGAGTVSQAALLRGDGRHLSAATVRDAPHVMGLGYIAILARTIEAQLQQQVRFAAELAAEDGQPREEELYALGMVFGTLTVYPDGTLDTSRLTALSPDLKIRPFGHKGRHATLEALVDEALQLHHGVQSTSRVEVYASDAPAFLGPGSSPFDRDADGVQSEASPGQAVLLGSYLAMLGTPVIRPPRSARMAFVWGRGRQVFSSLGCDGCHVPVLRIPDYALTIEAQGSSSLAVPLDLGAVGQEPVPRQTDHGPDDDGFIPAGIPIFAFTDLKRHAMGPDLAEPAGEVLPDGAGVVPGDVWLTRPLWGLADTAPYLHDGRAPTVDDAIALHGGEAADVRDAWRAASPDDQGALRVFLMSLGREPSMLVE